MTVPLHVRRQWWDAANARRQRLIQKKYKGGGITKAQEDELFLLQAVADLILKRYAPLPKIDFSAAAWAEDIAKVKSSEQQEKKQ